MLITCAEWQGLMQDYYRREGHWPPEGDPLWDRQPADCPTPDAPEPVAEPEPEPGG